MISTMLSGTAGTSLPESRRPPGRAVARGPSSGEGHWRIRTLSSVPRRRPGKARPRWPGASARQRHPLRPAYRPGPPQDQATHEPAPVDVAGPVPRRAAGVTGTTSGAGSMRAAPRRRRCDAPVPVRATIAPGGGDAWYGRPATAGHPGAIGLPPARRSLPVLGLHQPVGRGGRRRPDRADVQPPPVPLAGAPPCSAVLPEMVRLPPGAWVISTRRAWVLGETGMVRCRTPSA